MREPLEWQLEAAARAASENLIVFAETGSGKTMVAELAIKEALRREPRKRCAFMVTATRLLAHQQRERIWEALQEERPTRSEEVVEVTGYTTSDWGLVEWRNCMERAKVLVGTVETLHRASSDHGFVDLAEFSLIVLDECHKATGLSPGAELLEAAVRSGPRLLGLTASYANDGAELRRHFEQSCQALQDIFRGRLHRCEVPPRPCPRFQRIDYVKATVAVEVKAEKLAEKLCERLWEQLKPALRRPKECGAPVRRLSELLVELGAGGFDHGLQDLLAQVRGKVDNMSKVLEQKQVAKDLEVDLVELQRGLGSEKVEEVRQEAKRSFPVSSEKYLALLDCLRQELLSDSNAVGMVFVEKVSLAAPLAALLGSALGQPVRAVSGVNSMTEAGRNAAFQAFRQGAVRILVCTACAEEGLDVAECSYVVRFNEIHTTRSHVQGVGRARAQEARVYYFDNCPRVECERAQVMRDVAREAQGPGPKEVPRWLQRSAVHPFPVRGSGVEVNIRSAARILSEYLSQVEGVSFKKLQVKGGVRIPGPGGGLKLQEEDVGRLMDQHDYALTMEESMKYVAVLALHHQGWLDSNNCVPRRLRPLVPRLWEPESLELTLSVCQAKGGEAGEREHGASGLEQLDLGSQRVQLSMLENTQATVNKKFSNGGSVLKAMKDMVQEQKGPEDFPAIRCAWCPRREKWFSADNRRLFMFKVVAPLINLVELKVSTINWTSEMDYKLNQTDRWGNVWSTHPDGVAAARSELTRSLAGEEDEVTMVEDARSSDILQQLEDVLAMPAPSSLSALPRPPKRRKQPKERGEAADGAQDVGPALGPGASEESPEEGGAPTPSYALPATPSYALPAPSSHLPVVEGAPRPPQTRPRRRHEGSEGPRPLERVQVDLGRRAEELLMRVGSSLSKNDRREEEEGAVSLLKEALDCHCRFKDIEELPWSWKELEEDHGFRSRVTVCGKEFLGEKAPSKRCAKRKAAVAAIKGLVALAEMCDETDGLQAQDACGTQEEVLSEDSEWHVLECEDSQRLRVELLLEPSGAPLDLMIKELRSHLNLEPLAQENAAWVVELLPQETLATALRSLESDKDLELIQDGCVVAPSLRVEQLSCLRFEVREAEPW